MILLGSSWCPNTRAVIGQINDVANEYGVKTIYNFDLKLDGVALHIRDTKNPYASLYVDLVRKQFPGIVTTKGEYPADAVIVAVGVRLHQPAGHLRRG